MKAIRVVGCILAALQFLISVFLVYMLYVTKLVPFKIMVIVAVVLALLPIIVVIMMKGKKSALVGMLLSVIMSGVLCYGIYFIGSTNKALDDVTGNKTEVEQVNVYVAVDDPIDSINAAAAAGYAFGVIKSDDSEGVNDVISQINSDLGMNITIAEFESVNDLAIAFDNKQIQSFIINSGMLGLLESSEGYENYSSKLKIIMEKEVESQIVEQVEDKAPFDKNRFCMYISGIDTFGSVNIKSRSDVNIIAVINTETRTMLLVSTPRDYYVEFPNLGNRKDKLTHAGVFGIETSMGTLEHLYGIDLSYYVRMNFTGFKAIIDELGGIDVYCEYGFTGIDGDVFEEGMNHLDGDRALAFARERMAFLEGDRMRGNNQMTVIKAVFEKMQSAEILSNYATIIDSLSGTFQTDMTKDEVGEIVQKQLSDMKGWNIYSYSVSGSDGTDICSSVGAEAYVMYPYEEDVEYGKELINKVLGDGTLDQDEINEFMTRND
ncbi:MAG: LCP family protein [Eubacterium sp.]|nr:LCP family protein [Eubacterium sp.]